MKTSKNKSSVKYNYHKSGSLSEVLSDFIFTMQEITGGDVDVTVDVNGKVTFYFNKSDVISKRPDKTVDPEDKETRIFNLTERIKEWKINKPKIEKRLMNHETYKSTDVKVFKDVIMLKYIDNIDARGIIMLN